jgi:hypothetical protein
MPNDDAIKFGILKCRDLVELYYGARMVTSIVETQVTLTTDPKTILTADPRRIKYEIVMSNRDALNPASWVIGRPGSVGAATGQAYSIPPGATLVVERDFLTDMESVCLALEATVQGNTTDFSVRETFLTPIPVDEMP